MTEHAAVVFVFFFLAEYASILLICILTSILFLGGYLYDYISITYFIQFINFEYYLATINNNSIFNNIFIEGLFYSLSLAIKSCIMVFIFI
jgi:NADH-ubiquinone oxidoreductase chain 1